MKRMAKDASLHEKAVQAVARGDVSPTKRRRAGKGDNHRATTFKAVTVDRRVMRKVRQLNPGSRYAIVIEGETSVLITNRMRKIG